MNRLNIVLSVLLVLQVGWLVSEKYLVGDSYQSRRSMTGDSLLPRFDPAQVATLEMRRASGTTTLERQGEGWVVASEGSRMADQNLVQTALTALDGLKPGNVVSENPAKHQDFDVAGENAIEVTARSSSGTELARLILGKTTPDWRGVYLRYPAESDDVMLVRNNIRNTFDKDGGAPGAWRDKTVFQADSRAIREFEIVRPEETVIIQRQLAASMEEGKEGELIATDEDDWKVIQPVEGLMSRYAGNNLARVTATLKCDGFVSDAGSLAEVGLDPPEARVTARMADGSSLVFAIGKERDSKRIIKVPDRDDLFTVPAFQLLTFLKKGEELPEKLPEVEQPEQPAPEQPAGESEGDAGGTGDAEKASGSDGTTGSDDGQGN